MYNQTQVLHCQPKPRKTGIHPDHRIKCGVACRVHAVQYFWKTDVNNNTDWTKVMFVFHQLILHSNWNPAALKQNEWARHCMHIIFHNLKAASTHVVLYTVASVKLRPGWKSHYSLPVMNDLHQQLPVHDGGNLVETLLRFRQRNHLIQPILQWQ